MGWSTRAPIAVLLSALAVSMTSAGVLAAGNPDRQPFGTPPDVVGPFCGASVGDIIGHVAIQREYIKTFTSSNGVTRYMVEGCQQDSFTVVATGKSISVNASGPGVITDYPNGTETLQLFGYTIFVAIPPAEALLLYTGNVVANTSNGTITSHKGGVKDLCLQLR